MHKNLEAAGIPSTLVLDSAIGYVMEQVDFVMVGAEGVVESGGIVNKVSTFTLSSKLNRMCLVVLYFRWEVIRWQCVHVRWASHFMF